MFTLTKHYFDGIDATGNTFICYRAELDAFGIRLPYSALLFHPAGGTLSEQGSLKHSGSGCVFEHPAFGICARWQPERSAEAVCLLAQPDGRVDWHAHAVRADFQAAFHGRHYCGLGYAETLRLGIAPWRLPISELYWGRFLSERHTLVWIEWRGSRPLRHLWLDGHIHNRFTLDRCRLQLPDIRAELFFGQPETIKDEPLLALAGRFPVLRPLFPKRFLASRETKYKSPARLVFADGGGEEGWALYEKVLWQQV